MDLLRRNVNENLGRAELRRGNANGGNGESGDNGGSEGEDGNTSTPATQVQVFSLGWSADEEELKTARDSGGRELYHTVDVVIGSDVIYEYANIVPLLTTAKALLSDDAEAFFVLAYVHRSDYLWVLVQPWLCDLFNHVCAYAVCPPHRTRCGDTRTSWASQARWRAKARAEADCSLASSSSERCDREPAGGRGM
jgi:hypothetical protein